MEVTNEKLKELEAKLIALTESKESILSTSGLFLKQVARHPTLIQEVTRMWSAKALDAKDA